MEDLEKQLVCPVCLEMFSKPVVILPCQHNLCRKCASDVFQSRSSGVSGGSGSGGGRFRCPSCRHEVILDRHGVYGLQRNLLVENIIDIYRQQHRCVQTVVPRRLVCEEHPEEHINVYCEECETPICSMCKVFGSHKNCEVSPLSSVFLRKKSELSDGIAGLVAVNDHIQALISQMEEVCRTVEENGRSRRELISQSVDGLVHILEQRKHELISAITEEQDERLRHARSLIHTHTLTLENGVSLVQLAITATETPHMATFIQTAQDILQKMSERSGDPQRPELGFENMTCFSIDTEEVSEKLRNLHFCHESVNFDDDEDDEEETELETL